MKAIYPRGIGAALAAALFVSAAWGQAPTGAPTAPRPAADEPVADAAPGEPTPEGLVKLSEAHDIWIDKNRKAVVMDGEVTLREGQLEMFACPKGTKEHESIVVLNCLPEQAHAGLLAVGAKPGSPVQFHPEYKAAAGQVVDVYVLWKDERGAKRQARAQEWVKYTKTEKAMPYDWVFAGSGFWRDEETGQQHYKANGGDFICVSNFPTATLDLPVESSQANADLLFVAFTENIPPRGTKVRVVLIPRPEKKADEKKADQERAPQ
jgi:hypothetical protein